MQFPVVCSEYLAVVVPFTLRRITLKGKFICSGFDILTLSCLKNIHIKMSDEQEVQVIDWNWTKSTRVDVF